MREVLEVLVVDQFCELVLQVLALEEEEEDHFAVPEGLVDLEVEEEEDQLGTC